jgi:hypothetical protein
MRFSVNRDALYMPKSDLRQTQGTLAPIPPENSLRPLSPASISDRWCARMDRHPKRLFYGICWCNVGHSGDPAHSYLARFKLLQVPDYFANRRTLKEIGSPTTTMCTTKPRIRS